MDYKTQVETILSKRKEFLEEIKKDEQIVNEMNSSFQMIKRDLLSINSNGIDKILPVIDESLSKLEQASDKIYRMKKRFSRETVNIGVAGPARVGKSTFLQSLTGLTDDQIPSGAGVPVTAVRSKIFNQPKSVDQYAIIDFYSESEFIEKRISPYADLLGIEINSLYELKTCKLPDSVTGENQVRKNTAISKLSEFKKLLENYEEFLGKRSEKVFNLKDLREYVSYSPTGKYAAVKNVEIYCNFPSLEEVKLQVIDLPGFGEIGKVDKIQIEGLESDVDHAMLILRPEEQTAFVGEQYASISDTLSTVQKEVKKRNNLISVILNKKESAGIEELAKNLRSEILRKDTNVHENENLYDVNAINAAEVGVVFGKILNRMLSALQEMDKDFVIAYKSDLGFAKIKKELVSVQEEIKNLRRATKSDIIAVTTKAKHLREDFWKKFNKLNDEIEASNERVKRAVIEIHKQVGTEIKNDLMFEPSDRYKTWEEWMDYKSIQGDDVMYPSECNRLRIKILKRYEELDKLYDELMEELKEKIISIFREYTGSFADADKTGTESIKEILVKLKNSDNRIESFETAFTWLIEEKLNFRQNVYPMIFSANDITLLNPNKNHIKTDMLPEGRVERFRVVKEKLLGSAIQNNTAIKKAITDFDYSGDFMLCVLENFADLLIRSNEEGVENDFISFVDQFRDYLWDKEDFSVEEREVLNNLSMSLRNVISLIEKVEA